METYFSASKMLGHLRSWPSGPYLDGFAAALEQQGYCAGTAVRYLRAAARLGHVVARQGAMPSRWGFAYLLKQHVATAAHVHSGLGKKRISPHVLRHTCAMIILQATQDIRKVSLWLGHATLTTTEIYTRGDPTEKLDAMESIVPPHLRRGAFQPPDRLIALLKRSS